MQRSVEPPQTKYSKVAEERKQAGEDKQANEKIMAERTHPAHEIELRVRRSNHQNLVDRRDGSGHVVEELLCIVGMLAWLLRSRLVLVVHAAERRGDDRFVGSIRVNLEDAEIRAGIKDYSNWPTIPQLYVKGEFIGGSDIMMEMYESGELLQVLNSTDSAPGKPS